MLKIKDNVDLEELEKFGLKPRYVMANEQTGKTSIEGYHSLKYQPRFGYCTFRRKKGNAILNIVNRTIFNRRILNFSSNYAYVCVIVIIANNSNTFKIDIIKI